MAAIRRSARSANLPGRGGDPQASAFRTGDPLIDPVVELLVDALREINALGASDTSGHIQDRANEAAASLDEAILSLRSMATVWHDIAYRGGPPRSAYSDD